VSIQALAARRILAAGACWANGARNDLFTTDAALAGPRTGGAA
jgi:hypothetical protein